MLYSCFFSYSYSASRYSYSSSYLEETEYSYPAYWSASSRELPRSKIGIAAVQTAIEYEYRFTEYRFAEYEYDEIRCEARSRNR